MLRGAASKVMWVGRATVFLVGLAVILALVLGSATTAMGANGNPFLLGKKNVASAISTLVKQGPGPALSLVVEADQPPLRVNSAARVANLNADKLDGKDASALRPLLAAVSQQGTASDSPDVVSAQRTGEGIYVVEFARDVDGCHRIASLGLYGAFISTAHPARGEVTTYNVMDNTATVQTKKIGVTTGTSSGTTNDMPFTLAVYC